VATPGSDAEKTGVDGLLAGAMGVSAKDVPDVAGQLALPALRGAEVSVK
jgi:hypothetical protein